MSFAVAWLAGCTRQDWGTSGGDFVGGEPVMIGLHSMETDAWPSYSKNGLGMSAPHFGLDTLTGERRQHIPMTKAARALARPPGSGPTNGNRTIQIEIKGTCAPIDYWQRNGWRQPLPYLPDMGADQIEHVARLLADITRALGRRRLRYVGGNRPFPQAARMSPAEWAALPGTAAADEVLVHAHQDVAWNSHVDTGRLPIEAIIARANAILNPPTPPKEWDDMASRDEVKAALREVLAEPKVLAAVARAVLMTDGIVPAPRETTTNPDGTPIAGANTHLAAATVLQFGAESDLRVERKVNELLAAAERQD